MQPRDREPPPPPPGAPPAPPFRRARFRAAAHHACWACEDPRALGVERLHLVLWRADRDLHLRRGRPLTGATYLRHRAGPRAPALEAQLRELEREGLLARRPGRDGTAGGLLFALAPPAPGGLAGEEVAALEAALRAVCLDPRGAGGGGGGGGADEAVWRAALLGEALPYFTVCAGRAGDLSPADLAWAAREAEAAAAAGEGGPPRVAGAAGRPRAGEAVEALLWHLRRDPSLGASVPGAAGSWFAHRQAGVAGAGVPEVCAAYRLELDELVPAAVRVGPAPDELGDEDEDGG